MSRKSNLTGHHASAYISLFQTSIKGWSEPSHILLEHEKPALGKGRMNSQVNARQLALDAAVVLPYAACSTTKHAMDSVLMF
jgi:hypothetical protein